LIASLQPVLRPEIGGGLAVSLVYRFGVQVTVALSSPSSHRPRDAIYN